MLIDVSWADALSSGPAGLLVGSVLGLLLSVVAEDRLKDLRSRAYRRFRLATGRRRDHERRVSFSLGPLRTSCRVLEGDGETVIAEDAVHVLVDPRMVELPADLVERRTEIAERERAKRERGERYAWNGETFAVAGFVASRQRIDEAPEVFLRLRHCDYHTFLATQELDRPFPDGTTPRSRYLADGPPEDGPVFMAGAFGVNMAVVTADGRLMLSRRGTGVAEFADRWSVSANEGLSRSMDAHGRTPPNLYAVARRGLHEELVLEPHEYELRLLAFFVLTAEHQWGAAFVVRLHDLTARELEDRFGRGGPDLWEHAEHVFVPFEPRSVIAFTLDDARRERWAPHAPAVNVLALVNEFGRARVEAELRRRA